MTEELKLRTENAALNVLVAPDAPTAGLPMTLTVTIRDWQGAWPEACEFVLLDDAGQMLAAASAEADAETGQPGVELAATAPAKAGPCRWRVLLRHRGGEAPEQGLLAVEATFDVQAHGLRPVIWDLPSAIESGARFGFRVGLHCTGGCSARGWGFRVIDHDEREVAIGAVGDTPAPGTDALFFAEVASTAPEATGRYDWRIEPVAPETAPLPHSALTAELRLSVVARPEHVIRVRAVDAVSGAPVARAKVVAHPFRTLTGADGHAELRVPPGRYRIFVSGQQYFPVRHEAEVEGDVAFEAEMHLDRAYSEVDEWA